MPTQLLKPAARGPREIRCNVADAMVANLAVHLVFFYPRHLDARTLASAFAKALNVLPVFSGRVAVRSGRMRIRCGGHGVPFTVVASDRTLSDAIASASQDRGDWLIDPVKGAVARWGWGPLCRVRVTHLADKATAIGFSWHHAVGDMQTAMQFMNAWTAAAGGRALTDPLIVDDRAAYLDEHLPDDGAHEPGVRCLGIGETARVVLYLAKDAHKQRTLTIHFPDDEIARMREAYRTSWRLSANDIVCAHVAEAVIRTCGGERRRLAIAVNARSRCGLEPTLIGNILTTVSVELRRGEAAISIAERLRHRVDHFTDTHCDMRINQRFLDAVGPLQAARCVSRDFDPVRWNLLVSNWSGFDIYGMRFEDTAPDYVTPVMKLPVAGLAALLDGPGGRGLIFMLSLPRNDFDAMLSPDSLAYLHRYRGETA